MAGAKEDVTSDFSESLFLRDEGFRDRYSGLPPDVLAQSARRLRILALLYAFVFFMAGYFPVLFPAGKGAPLPACPGGREQFPWPWHFLSPL
jgi:hypothetical protein